MILHVLLFFFEFVSMGGREQNSCGRVRMKVRRVGICFEGSQSPFLEKNFRETSLLMPFHSSRFSDHISFEEPISKE